jgi:hypothetical protein
MDVPYHFVHEKYEKTQKYQLITLAIANIMTKSLPCENFQNFRYLMGFVNMNSLPFIAYGK